MLPHDESGGARLADVDADAPKRRAELAHARARTISTIAVMETVSRMRFSMPRTMRIELRLSPTLAAQNGVRGCSSVKWSITSLRQRSRSSTCDVSCARNCRTSSVRSRSSIAPRAAAARAASSPPGPAAASAAAALPPCAL